MRPVVYSNLMSMVWVAWWGYVNYEQGWVGSLCVYCSLFLTAESGESELCVFCASAVRNLGSGGIVKGLSAGLATC